jgi:hypothetical protein
MGEFPGAAALVAACAALLIPPSATAQATPAAAVTPADQAARDDERLRILRDELARELAVAADAAKRRAERLAAADARGAHEAEQAQARSADNVAALRREIAAALKQSQNGRPVEPVRVSTRPAGSAAPNPPATRARWWDVYAKPPRRPDAAPPRPVAPETTPAPTRRTAP